jgi:hypothetical protein
VLEELGSVLAPEPEIRVDEATLDAWEETRVSESFPGLRTVYRLFQVHATCLAAGLRACRARGCSSRRHTSQVDVRVSGLTRAATGTSFESVETPDEAYGKVCPPPPPPRRAACAPPCGRLRGGPRPTVA